MDTIRWLRIKNVCEKYADRTVHIYGSTDLPHRLQAAVTFTDERVNIAVNLSRSKSARQVIRAVAHEMVHVKNGTDTHDELEFGVQWDEMEKQIREVYYGNFPN